MMVQKYSFSDLIRINKFCLQSFGILPLNGRPTIGKRRFSNFLTTWILFCITFINVPIFHFIASAELNLEGKLDGLSVVAGAFGGELRMIFVALNRKRIQRLYAACRALWLDASLDDFKIISVWINRARFLSFILCSTTVIAVSLYIFLPVIKQITFLETNGRRSWPFQINMDSSQSPRYEIFYLVQSAVASFNIFPIIGCDLIGSVLALHVCGQLRLIQTWLLNISKEVQGSAEQEVDKYLEKRLEKCVRRHQIVMDLCLELEHVVCYINLAHAIGGMYMMAISAARLSRIRSIAMYKSFGLLFLGIGQLLLSCWPADKLFFESSMMTRAIYAVPWYRCSPRIRKAIIFMMTRSQHPARLTAGKFVAFSMQTFSSIVSTAISIFMLLRRFDPAAGTTSKVSFDLNEI